MRDYSKRRTQSRVNAARHHKKHMRRLCRRCKPIMTGLLEEKAREGARACIEDTLEVERDQFLGRDRHERTTDQAEFKGHRNGCLHPENRIRLRSGGYRHAQSR